MIKFNELNEEERYVWNTVFAQSFTKNCGMPWMAISQADSAIYYMQRHKRETLAREVKDT